MHVSPDMSLYPMYTCNFDGTQEELELAWSSLAFKPAPQHQETEVGLQQASPLPDSHAPRAPHLNESVLGASGQQDLSVVPRLGEDGGTADNWHGTSCPPRNDMGLCGALPCGAPLHGPTHGITNAPSLTGRVTRSQTRTDGGAGEGTSTGVTAEQSTSRIPTAIARIVENPPTAHSLMHTQWTGNK